MDVHHPSAEHYGKKTWKNYFWEFAMLFLAVFCGYLAEDRLENKFERNREKKYMSGMLSDLITDTIMMEKTIVRAQQLSAGLDSLRKNLNSYDGSNDRDLYDKSFDYMQWILPDFSDKTITQLRYSGNLRLIKDNEVAGEISDYWIGVNKIMRNSNEFIADLDKAEDNMIALFNRKYVTTKSFDPYYGLDNYDIDPLAVLMSTDRILINTYANRVGRLAEIAEHYIIPLLKNQLTDARQLVKMIKKEYNLH